MLKGMQSIIQFKTAHIWKVVIEDKKLRESFPHVLKRLIARDMMLHLMRSLLLDEFSNQRANLFIILYDHNHIVVEMIGCLRCRH